MSLFRRLGALAATLALAACASLPAPYIPEAVDGWTPVAARIRPVGLGLLPGAQLSSGVRFAGGIDVISPETTPLHGLSDLKILDGDLISVSDSGDLARARLRLDRHGRLTGLDQPRVRRLTLTDGSPITEKVDGDAEGLVITASGDLLISFERDHRIWNYGPVARPGSRPVAVAAPDFAFPGNDGMEGLSAGPDGWRAVGESGGVWDCSPAGCHTMVAPPEPLLADSDYRITGLDRDPAGAGWFVVQRRFQAPADVRARVRHMAGDSSLGPVLIELKHPGTVDNFEGIAAVATPAGTRLYLLSDDNFSETQRTLLLAFDVVVARH
ncbi:MAG: hypothetical protein ACI9YM_001652 [Brevundimonas sp.]|uniref:esterase-like activity of phytase family protein n=1 Tax=Brevundimonas sp. TaxID=1871086 RepID=UPI0039E6B154